MKRLRIAVLIALLIVPALLHGHRHDDRGATSSSCAVCVAAHHTPAVSAPAIVATAPAVAVRIVPARSVTACSKGERPFRVGRAPPLPLHIIDA